MATPVISVASAPMTAIEKLILSFGRHLAAGTAFEFRLPGRPWRLVGEGELRFRIDFRNEKAVNALKSMDEMRIGEAYLFGDLDIDGDLVAALDLRGSLNDQHPLANWWSVYGQKLFRGQIRSDAQWISEHYDAGTDFYLMFLDRQARCYSHGYFADEDEPLETAIQRKLGTAVASCGIQSGWRVLDIGAGWGAFTEYAGKRGIEVTSLTISKESYGYVNRLIEQQSLPCRVLLEHFLEHSPAEPYDAIVNLGVTEHLPDYAATLRQYQRLLKPGGRVFLDACATRKKHPFSTFALRYIWPGNTTPLVLTEYLQEVEQSPFEVLSIENDRTNYMLTTRHWAENLDRARPEIVQRFGEVLYRRFRLYLWGCVHQFLSGDVTAYRMLLKRK